MGAKRRCTLIKLTPTKIVREHFRYIGIVVAQYFSYKSLFFMKYRNLGNTGYTTFRNRPGLYGNELATPRNDEESVATLNRALETGN
jgi:hypothetical protein